MLTSDFLEIFGSYWNCRGKRPDSSLLRTPMKVAHRISLQKQNVLEKISSDLATLPLSESKVSRLPLYKLGKLDPKIQHSTTRQAKRKITGKLDNHWSKNCLGLFLCVETNWVCSSGTQRFCKNYSDVSSHWLWLDSSHYILNVTQVESESLNIVTRLESSHWLESHYHILFDVCCVN